MKILFLAIFLLSSFSNCFAQISKKKLKKGYMEYRNSTDNPYKRKDSVLYNQLLYLKYDSIKVYDLNCQLNDISTEEFFTDTPKSNNLKLPADKLLTNGKLMTNKDNARLIYILKNMYKDTYRDDPVSSFIPTIGVTFFYQNKAIAHLEQSSITNNMSVVICNTNHISYHNFWGIIGINTYKFFSAICKKYKLDCCKLKP